LLDIMPPGIDELLGVMRITTILEGNALGAARLVVDMAPTGHALELLRTPDRMLHWSRLVMKILAANRNLAVAQDVAVEVADLSQRVRALLETMRDPRRCQIAVVLLAEPLPDHETRRLMDELRALKLPAGAVFVNRVHFSAKSHCPRCDSAARWQKATLHKFLRQRKSAPLFAVPEFQQPIAGRSGLAKLTRDLWRVQAAKPKKR
jgi:arsenite-transporting ATPase